MSRKTQTYDAVVSAPFGLIGLRMRGNTLTAVDLRSPVRGVAAPNSAAARRVASVLERYFKDPAFNPALPFEAEGPPFQRRVWRALKAIPSGTTLTYGQLAKKLGTSARAVGGACRDNPVPIVVPCHRVVSASGAGGFMGETCGAAMDIKSWLLRHEARTSSGDRDQRK